MQAKDEALPPSGVQSIDRAVAILAAFTRERPIAGVSELARLTGMTRSTVHRLLSALTAHSLVQQLPDSTAYALGPRMLTFAEAARGHLTLEGQAQSFMTWLRDRTGETVGLHVLDDTPARRTVAQVESTQALRRTYTDLGVPRPAHHGAPGKALLAFADEATRQRVLRSKLTGPKGTGTTTTAELRRQLDEIVGAGYAISIEERVVGVVAIAAPVHDHTGQVVAALSVSIPAARAGREELETLAPVLIKATKGLSDRLGFDLPPPVSTTSAARRRAAP